MGTFLHATQRVSSRNMTKIGLMILLAHLKFCWRIINFAGAVFEVKLRQQTTCASKILLALRQKIPTLTFLHTFYSIATSKKRLVPDAKQSLDVTKRSTNKRTNRDMNDAVAQALEQCGDLL